MGRHGNGCLFWLVFALILLFKKESVSGSLLTSVIAQYCRRRKGNSRGLQGANIWTSLQYPLEYKMPAQQEAPQDETFQ